MGVLKIRASAYMDLFSAKEIDSLIQQRHFFSRGGGARGRSPARGENSGFFDFYAHFHARRRRGTPRASERFMCQRCGACPRERLPCRPPGRLRAGAPLQPASWPYRLSSLLSKLFPFIRAAAVGRSRPAESSTSLFDRLGVTSSTGTSQVSSAPRIPRRAAALLEYNTTQGKK